MTNRQDPIGLPGGSLAGAGPAQLLPTMAVMRIPTEQELDAALAENKALEGKYWDEYNNPALTGAQRLTALEGIRKTMTIRHRMQWLIPPDYRSDDQ